MTFYRFIKKNREMAPRFWDNVRYVNKHEAKFPRIRGKDLDAEYQIVLQHFRANGANQRCLDVVDRFWEAYATKIDPNWRFPSKYPLRLPRDMAYWSGAKSTVKTYPRFRPNVIKNDDLEIYFEQL